MKTFACNAFRLYLSIICQVLTNLESGLTQLDNPLEMPRGYLCIFPDTKAGQEPVMAAGLFLGNPEEAKSSTAWLDISHKIGRQCAMDGAASCNYGAASHIDTHGNVVSFFGPSSAETNLLVVLLISLELSMATIADADAMATKHNCTLFLHNNWLIGTDGTTTGDLRDRESEHEGK